MILPYVLLSTAPDEEWSVYWKTGKKIKTLLRILEEDPDTAIELFNNSGSRKPWYSAGFVPTEKVRGMVRALNCLVLELDRDKQVDCLLVYAEAATGLADCIDDMAFKYETNK